MSRELAYYYLRHPANPNNQQDAASFQVRERIENLRGLLSELFHWTGKGSIVFLPNAHYAKKLLLNYFSRTPKVRFLGNDPERDRILFESEGLELEHISTWNGEAGDKTLVLWYWEPDEQLVRPSGIRGLVIETLDTDVSMDSADAFIFNAMPGTTVLGFRSEMELEPLVLGSNSALGLRGSSYVPNRDPRSLESGTTNVPNLLEIESFFRNKIAAR